KERCPCSWRDCEGSTPRPIGPASHTERRQARHTCLLPAAGTGTCADGGRDRACQLKNHWQVYRKEYGIAGGAEWPLALSAWCGPTGVRRIPAVVATLATDG